MAPLETEQPESENTGVAAAGEGNLGRSPGVGPAPLDPPAALSGALSTGPLMLGEADQQFLLSLARRALLSAVTDAAPPEVSEPSARLAEHRACFITLTRHGELRGCVGQLLPRGPLYRNVIENVRGAALRDPRFSPIERDEIDELKIEISVLSEPQRLRCGSAELLERLRPHQDGVLLRVGYGIATFLPQVWEQIPEKTRFLEHLSQKAGCEASAWREPDAEISVYQAQCFCEN
jgi:AmmeMemoRadiSam system protein A